MITPNEHHVGKADDEHNDPLKQVQIIKEMTEQVRDSLAVIDLRCEIIVARLTNDDEHLIKCLKNAYAQYNAAVKHNAGLE